ncbi:A-kinase anchor protein 2-like isoform X3 [Scleropages formosus]|uniref:A-kinase anchor protein 2-like isoform X3 n=1 Tax=Scleropages formosus TaxID=113540 RepID=UPI0008789EE4|nr:A-kinase anchor protein 2 isoform X3 [Scleropages formosus]XP_018589879.1 A-kinase anchor protein 2 isoform X3 [Scleropages formosus]
MAEAELHKERLQALAEKRKLQAKIQEMRRQMEDLILQLQHLKSKAVREQWLLQGTSAVTLENSEERKREADQDELKVKKLEDTIHRLERKVELLENEECEISAKEQMLRERLQEMEKSAEYVQKSLHKEDGGQGFTSSDVMLAGNGLWIGMSSQTADVELKYSNISADATESTPKNVTSLGMPGNEGHMDLEAPSPVIQSNNQENLHHTSDVRIMKNGNETLDSEVAEEILYLDEVLEANYSDPLNDGGFGMQIPHNGKIFVEEKQQSTFIINEGTGKCSDYSGIVEENYSRLPEDLSETIKKEPHFELRAYQEEKKPSKLFDCLSDKELIRVKKVRSSDEIAELERERQELIKGQAVKKNPGIAVKWWNPPQQKTLEEELGQDQLESHRRYEERKQKKKEASNMPQTLLKNTAFSVMEPKMKKADIVVDNIDFSAARNQFLQRPDTGQSLSLAAELYSAKPSAVDITNAERPDKTNEVNSSTMKDTHDTTTIKTEKVFFGLEGSPTEQAGNNSSEKEHENNMDEWMDDEGFTCVRAVMTIIKDEDSSASSSCPSHIKELVSGLDDHYLQCQGTTMEATPSNNICMDNMSDNEKMAVLLETSVSDYSVSPTPQIIKSKVSLVPQTENFLYTTNRIPVLTEEQLEYYASILVQNAIKEATTQLSVPWELLQLPEQSVAYTQKPVEAEKLKSKHEPWLINSSEQEIQKTVMSPVGQEDTQSYSFFQPLQQCPTFSEKQEFSYFSKYSQAAELRSTASVARPQETGMGSGPFKLRSHKQRTLTMIEEEIRATQEREEELKRQRKMMTFNSSEKYKNNSIPKNPFLTSKTTCGKTDMIHVSTPPPSSSEDQMHRTFSDLSSEESGGSQHPKNLMQTLMEDYELNKTKRSEKIEETKVSTQGSSARRSDCSSVNW